MKKFIIKVSIFLISTSIFYIFPVAVLFIGRETFSGHDAVLQQQKHPEALVGYAYGVQSFIPYKEALVTGRDANVIALGTSRVMQFRKEFFKDQDRFANAGGAATSFTDVKNFIDFLPNDGKKRFVILGFEKEFFLKTPQETGVRKGDSAENNTPKRIAYLLLASTRRIYIDTLSKYSITSLWNLSKNNNDVGIMATVEDDGFRSDGSRLYKNIKKTDLESWAKNEIHIRAGEYRDDKYTAPTDDLSIQNNLEMLSTILETCKKKNITLIGFNEPYPTEAYNAIQESSDTSRKIMNEIPKEVSKMFSQYSFPFYDLSKIDTFGGSDREFIDNIHGSDLMNARIVLFMGTHNKEVENIIDENGLKKMINKYNGNIYLPF